MGKRKAVDDDVGEGVAKAPKHSSSSGIIEAANALSQDEFKVAFWDSHKYDHLVDGPWPPEMFYAEHMGRNKLKACFDLIEETSRHDYEPSSFGWYPLRKLREMKEKEMRYIVLRSDGAVMKTVKGFLSFMLTYDSVPSVPVLYVYEIHLNQSSRRQGSGRRVMEIAEDIARRVGVEKVMLTCFKSNTKAMAFYEVLGYAVDVSSPEDRTTRKKVVKTDYVIMSKEVSQQLDGGLDLAVEDNSVSALKRQSREQVARGSTSEAVSYLAELTDSYRISPEPRAWIEADCCTGPLQLMEEQHIISVLEQAKRLIAEVDAHRKGYSSTQCLQHARVLIALYAGLQERFSRARDLQFAAWRALEPLNRDFHDLGIQAYADTLAPTGPESLVNESAPYRDESLSILADLINTMPSNMRQQLCTHLKTTNAEFAEREAALDMREQELDQWEDDMFARETALHEANARHVRARQNIRARAQALKQREERFAAREKRSREQTAKEVAERELLEAEILRAHQREVAALERNRETLTALQQGRGGAGVDHRNDFSDEGFAPINEEAGVTHASGPTHARYLPILMAKQHLIRLRTSELSGRISNL